MTKTPILMALYLKGALLLSLMLLVSCTDDCPDVPKMAFEQSTLELYVGEQATPKLLHTPKATITWQSSNPKIATVQNGTITAIEPGTAIITATAQGSVARLTLTVLEKKGMSETIAFGDKRLLQLILAQHPTADANNDGQLSPQEALTVTSLKFGYKPDDQIPEDKKITDLKGLEYFLNLDSLDVNSQPVGSSVKSIEGLTKLKYLRIGYVGLSEINTSQMPELLDLRLFGNKDLHQIDLSNNKKLQELYCQDTKLTELDLTQLAELQKVLANRCKLRKIIWGQHPKLERIELVKNQLTSLDLSNMPLLQELHADNNQLQSVQLKNLPSLQRLNLYQNHLKQIDLSQGFEKLMFLFLFDNALTEIDLSHLPKLFKLMISKNPLHALDCSSNPIIREITAEEMPEMEWVNLKNGGYNEEAQYEIATDNPKLTKVIVDAGDEETHLKNVFKNNPKVQIVTEP